MSEDLVAIHQLNGLRGRQLVAVADGSRLQQHQQTMFTIPSTINGLLQVSLKFPGTNFLRFAGFVFSLKMPFLTIQMMVLS